LDNPHKVGQNHACPTPKPIYFLWYAEGTRNLKLVLILPFRVTEKESRQQVLYTGEEERILILHTYT